MPKSWWLLAAPSGTVFCVDDCQEWSIV
jgi:hypothetical protein